MRKTVILAEPAKKKKRKRESQEASEGSGRFGQWRRRWDWEWGNPKYVQLLKICST